MAVDALSDCEERCDVVATSEGNGQSRNFRLRIFIATKATKEGDETHIIGKNFFQLLVAMFSYRGFGKKE